MGMTRKPWQGVANIVRFNWHFYAGAGIALAAGALACGLLPTAMQPFALGLLVLGALVIVASLAVSYYVYDVSDLYQLNWLTALGAAQVLNINAGFDETSAIIQHKFPGCDLTMADFYNPQHHTEVSIRRARRAYPPVPGTITVGTGSLPFADGAFDAVVAILSAHEIRDHHERATFFQELNRITQPTGRIFVTEHLRDLNNFMAYTVGFLHFHSRATWLLTFARAGLVVRQEIKITPFITTFILAKNGDSL